MGSRRRSNRGGPRKAGTRKSGSQHRPLGGVAGPESRQEKAGRTWSVRPIPGQSAKTSYVCPMCGQQIRSGEGHVVVWPVDEVNGLQQRRHWHSRCWGRYR